MSTFEFNIYLCLMFLNNEVKKNFFSIKNSHDLLQMNEIFIFFKYKTQPNLIQLN